MIIYVHTAHISSYLLNFPEFIQTPHQISICINVKYGTDYL